MKQRARDSLRFAIFGLAIVAFPLLLLWRPLLAGEAFFWGTPLLQFVPWQRMAAHMWRSGHAPLWNPLVGCGAPLAANHQTAAFYPLNALYLLLPAEVALTWTVAFHVALAGWGMYRWGRAVGLDRFPAFIAALALEGSGFLVARVALFPSIALTFPWLVVWLWRAEVLVRQRRLRDTLWLGLSVGLGLLAGHAQTAFHGGVLVVIYSLFRALQEARAGGARSGLGRFALRLSSLLAGSFVIGVGLAAIQLLPTVELMALSQRSQGVGYRYAMTYSLWPWRLITFLAPDFFGNPGRGDYWGYATYWEDAGYVGVLPLLLALGAAFGRKRGRGRGGQAWFWAAWLGISLVLALGQNTPVFPFLFRHVPGLDLFQAPARWLAITTIALAALAGLGAQWWSKRGSGWRGGKWVVVGAALLIGGLAAPRLVAGLKPTFGRATALLGGMLVVAGGLALLRRDSDWWRAAVAIFVTLDLLIFGWPLVPAVDRSLYQGVTEAGARLHGEPGPVRVYWPTDPAHTNRDYDAEQRVKFGYLAFDDFGPRGVGRWREVREALLPNVGMLDGVALASNFDPLLVGRYVDLLDAAVEAPGVLPVMGVTHVVSDQPWPGGELIYAGSVANLYRLPDALGRAWVVPAARQVAAEQMPAALADTTFDPAAEVLLELPALRSRASLSGLRSLTLQDGPNRVTIRAALDAPGYLVLADTWYPGWRATVDGEPAEILRANYAFRAVWLEAGERTVEMIYRPTSVLVGGVVSVGAVIVLIAGMALTRAGEAQD